MQENSSKLDAISDFTDVEAVKVKYNCRFVLKVVPLYVEFKNTKSKNRLCEGYYISTNCLEGFLHEIWEIAQDKVKREIICDPVEKTQQFTDKEIPDVRDVGIFLKIIDSVAHSTVNPSQVDEDRLDYWSDGRLLELHIYPYGTSVITRADWNGIHKGKNALIPPVETDKTGAVTEQEVDNMVEILKDAHSLHYSAADITWRAWADFILKKKYEERELFVHKPPPYKLIDLFKAVQVDPESQLASLVRDVSIAEGVSEGVQLDIDGLIQSFECVMASTQVRVEAEKIYLQKLNAFKAKMTVTKDTLNLVNQKSRPHENALSEEYVNLVTNVEDCDHIDFLEEEN